MHSMDLEPEPHEVFLGLGLLITEGRLPGNNTSKGFCEGPHISPFVSPNPKLHKCETDNFLCGREENLRKHVTLLWGMSIPLCIEVLLCSDCSCGKEKATTENISPIPDSAYVLIEKWMVSTSMQSPPSGNGNGGGRRGSFSGGQNAGENTIEGKGLLQAVRSFLHFSQLAAWLQRTNGSEPRHVMYRVTIPQMEFAHQFVRTPEDHEFPLAVIKNHTIKVKVKSLPRSERIPIIYCSNLVCPRRVRSGSSGKSSPLLSAEGLFDPSPLPNPRRFGSPSRESPDLFLEGSCKSNSNSSGVGIPDDRLPPSCNQPGKHCCNQDHEEEYENVDALCYKPRGSISGRSSRQDLYLNSLANRFHFQPSFGTCQHHYSQRSLLQGCRGTEEREGSPTSASEDDGNGRKCSRPIPTFNEKLKFQKSLDSAASLVFHGKTKLPLTSSPAPLRKENDRFDFDSTLTSPSRIKACFGRPRLTSSETSQRLLGSFEESCLNGRMMPVSTVEGFTAELGASGSFCPDHRRLPVTVFFYTFSSCDNKISTPYMAHINLGRKGYVVPKKGTVQVTLFNPNQTVIKMFVTMYDLSMMPPDSQTFIRQRIFYMPLGESDNQHPEARKWLRYLIHLRFSSSRSGKIYLHTDIRIIVFRKSDADAATGFADMTPHELRSFTDIPQNPRFSPRFSNSSSASSTSSSLSMSPLSMSSSASSSLTPVLRSF